MMTSSPIRITSDLVEAVGLLEGVVTREGYRLVATHPLFKYAFDGGYTEAPKAVSLDFDAPKLAHFWPLRREPAAWLLPVRFSIVAGERLILISPDPTAVRCLLGELNSLDEQRAWSWFEVTMEIITAYMSGTQPQ